MGKQVKLLTVVIGFVQARPKAIRIARDQPRSKVTGNQTLIRQITYPAENGSAVGASQ
jgi:hypothetical protein